jgi:gas vesicle protein
MWPLAGLVGVVVGAVAGAAGAVIYGPQLAQHGRPAAKAALKAALHVIHEARVKGAEVAEAAEDLYAEAKAEVSQEALAAVMAKAKAEAEAEAAEARHEAAAPGTEPPRAETKPGLEPVPPAGIVT